MTSTPPFVRQERPDACAIACLRMILAHHGHQITEEEVVELTDLQEGGLSPAEVSRLASHFGLTATEMVADQTTLLDLVERGRIPIVFFDRRPLDGVDMTHAVIPLRCSKQYVKLLDPLRGERRVSLRKREQARRRVGNWVVVWGRPFGESEPTA